MDHKELIKARESHKKVLGKRLIHDHTPLPELVQENPELIWDYNRLKANLENYKLDLARTKPDCKDFIPNNFG